MLTERLSQDPLENYFGCQRSIGRRKDNPVIRDFGNSVRNQKVFRPIGYFRSRYFREEKNSGDFCISQT